MDFLKLNTFFHSQEKWTKILEENARNNIGIISPVEATIHSRGRITIDTETLPGKAGFLVSMKKKIPENIWKKLVGGTRLNMYLSPLNTHFWIAPETGKIVYTKIHPGKATLFPLLIGLEKILYHIPYLRHIDLIQKALNANATATTIIETEKGPLVLIALGSLGVNSMDIFKKIGENIVKGEPIGHFNLGSSMILLSPPSITIHQNIQTGYKFSLGEEIEK